MATLSQHSKAPRVRALRVFLPKGRGYSAWKNEGNLWICYMSTMNIKWLVGLDHFQARKELVERDLKYEWVGSPVKGE